MFTSVDRTFEPGIYIFFPTNTSTPFDDNACTLTQPFSSDLEVINPLGGVEPDVTVGTMVTTGGEVEATTAATAVVGATSLHFEAPSGPAPGWIAAAAMAGLFAGSWWCLRRRST